MVAGDGYGEERWWEGMEGADRRPVGGSWGESNHPRESVSWYEAVAYSRWLGSKLGREVRLPTEWEWERAAGGRKGREYPWGKGYKSGYANIDETWGKAGDHKLGRTSAVGIYEKGGSEEGVMDLSGNVWEWCLNENEGPERREVGGAESRVLRGGSWGNITEHARAFDRYNNHPDVRSYDIGFRVVCSSPIAGR